MTSLRDQLQATLGESYSIERELGGGGMSRVYVVRDETLGRDVVVKVIAPEQAEGLSAERFAREVKLAARLQQANIVPVLTAGISGVLPYYTMPFVRGESLRARLATGRPVGLAEGVSILRDVARALAYAHAEGVVHRDIKPENILLSGGAAVVTDFGIAKAIAVSRTQANATAGITQAGVSLGTPAYMAPEQALGDPNTDHRADIYAWGVVAWELLGGVHPFAERTSMQALIAAHIAEQPPSLSARRPEVPAALAALVMRCLEKSPASRPQSASDLLGALESVNTSGDVVAPAVTRPTHRRTFVVAGAGIVVAVAAIVAFQRMHRVAAVADADRSLAVLPFTAVGGDTANSYLAEGISDEVSNTLAQVPGVQLAGRSSAARFAGKGSTPQEIGAALHVGSVLDGTVRREGDQIHVTAELSNTSDGMVAWHDSYVRPAKDVFAVQDEIARAIAGRLQVSLSDAGPGSLATSGTRDATAYDLYLKGMYLYRRRGPGIADAISTLDQATARDTMFARAWAGLSTALTVSPSYLPVRASDVLQRARAAAQRAVRLDPKLSDAHLALGYVYAEQFQWAAADSELGRAIALAPNSAEPRYRLAYSLVNQGRSPEAIAQLRRAEALDPLYFLPAVYLGAAKVREGQIAEGLEELRRGVALEPRGISGLGMLAGAYDRAGNPDSARAVARRMLEISSQPARIGMAAFVLARNGDRRTAEAIARKLEALPPTTWTRWTGLEQTYLGLGDTARAIDAAEHAAAGDGDGFPTYALGLHDGFGENPRMVAVLRRFNLDPARFTADPGHR
jgi:serine/threonine-protein kinase